MKILTNMAHLQYHLIKCRIKATLQVWLIYLINWFSYSVSKGDGDRQTDGQTDRRRWRQQPFGRRGRGLTTDIIHCGLVTPYGYRYLDGLFPEGTKPLDEPILSNHLWGLVHLPEVNFHRICSTDLSLTRVWKLLIQDYNRTPNMPNGPMRCEIMKVSLASLMLLLSVQETVQGWHHWHDDVIKWKNNPRYWPSVRGIHRTPLTKVSGTELWRFLWYVPEQTFEQTIETRVIWDAIALIMMSL